MDEPDSSILCDCSHGERSWELAGKDVGWLRARTRYLYYFITFILGLDPN
jgi:hypothetical protein